MADGKQPFYLTEPSLQRIGGDPNEFFATEFTLEDDVERGYVLKVDCEIPDALQEGIAQACSARRGVDVEFFLRRLFSDGELLETRIAGLVESVERGVVSKEKVGKFHDAFVMTIVPAFELLKHNKTGGTWHNRSYADILFDELQKGLALHNRTVERRLSGEYPEIDFTVRRPGESLYDFARKLMRRTGISFFFDHEDGVEVMVLVDDNSAFPKAKQRWDMPMTASWSEQNATDQQEAFIAIKKDAGTVPPAMTFQSHFTTLSPQITLESVASFSDLVGSLLGALGLGGIGGGGGLGNIGLGGGGGSKKPPGSIVVHDGLRTNELDPQKHLETRAALEKEVKANTLNEMKVDSTITGLLAGRRLMVEFDPGQEREVVVSTVSARGARRAPSPGDYTNSVVLVPTVGDDGQDITIRPVQEVDEGHHFGVYKAEVIAIENDPVDVDKVLRCRLKFPWDEQEEEIKLTYVSVLQNMAGTHAGAQWFPRAGDRVLVIFVGGHHEQPVIIGSLYDAELLPPEMGPDGLRLPESSTWLGWTHASIGDKARQTQLNMKLDAGDELLFFNAPWNWLQKVGNDCDVEIVNNNTRSVGNDFKETVGNNYTQDVTANRTETVGGNYSLTVNGNANFSAKGGSTSTIDGAVKTTFKSGLKANIEGGAAESVNSGNRSFTVSAGTFSITSGRVVSITAPRLSLNVASIGFGGMGEATGGALDITSTARLMAPVSATVRGAKSEVKADSTGLSLEGPATRIRDELGGSAKLSNGKLVVEAPQGIEFLCGTNSMRLAPDGVFINGLRLDIDAAQTQIKTTAFDIIGPEPDANVDVGLDDDG